MAVSSSVVQSAAPGAVYAARAAPTALVALPQVGERAASNAGASPLPTNPGTTIKLSPEQVRAALQEFQHVVQKAAPGLQFSIDEDSGVTVVKLVDRQTQELVAQFPSEEMLHIARSVGRMQGLLVSKVA